MAGGSTIKGTGVVSSSDFKTVKWVGKTKGGQAVTVQLDDAINIGNIDWTFAEKDDVVPAIEFTACYDNTDATASSTAEPWTITTDATVTAGAGEILLGTGIFYIGSTAVALCRGGGKFTVEREFREQNADGDRGPVSGRVILEKSVAKLSMNVLSIMTRIADFYPAISVT